MSDKLSNEEIIKNSMRHEIVDKLTRAKRKFDACDDPRHAVLYCKKCGKRIGEYDMFLYSQDSLMYCYDCLKLFIKEVPFLIEDKNIVVLKDEGRIVKIFYQDSEYIGWKTCHFNSKGRFITCKGSRIYL